MTKTADWSFSDITLSVLGILEDSEWHAIALELDLHGYGDSFDEAMLDLMDHVKIQVSFAVQKELPDLIRFAADGTYWNLFAQARVEQMSDWPHEPQEDRGIRVGGFAVPPAHVIAKMRGNFTLATNG